MPAVDTLTAYSPERKHWHVPLESVLCTGYSGCSARGRARCLFLARRDMLHRHASSVANGGIAEIDSSPSIAEGDARDPYQTRRRLTHVDNSELTYHLEAISTLLTITAHRSATKC